MYPGKEHLLLAKWEIFKEQVLRFYEANVHNEFCKQLLQQAKSSANKGSIKFTNS